MKKLHTLSLLTGLGLAIAFAGLTSFDGDDERGKPLIVSLDPVPSTIVQIIEGQTFRVPARKIFVLKAVAQTDSLPAGPSSPSLVRVLFNNLPVLTVTLTDNPTSLSFPITAGSSTEIRVIEVNPDPVNMVFASGYLAGSGS